MLCENSKEVVTFALEDFIKFFKKSLPENKGKQIQLFRYELNEPRSETKAMCEDVNSTEPSYPENGQNLVKDKDPEFHCPSCGGCNWCDRCSHCGNCMRCGKPVILQPLPVVYPAPQPWYPINSWPVNINVYDNGHRIWNIPNTAGGNYTTVFRTSY